MMRCFYTFNFSSLHDDNDNTELVPPSPPPNKAHTGRRSAWMSVALSSSAPQTPKFNSIASGLKLAQAQAMAVAGFLPTAPPEQWLGHLTHSSHTIFNHRSSYHGRGKT